MAMRFRAHDTFFIRKGWLSKGMERIVAKPDLFVDKNENPMDILGIGTNMVKALRYWLQAVGLTEEPTTGRRVQNLTEFGQSVYENDRYIEELGTLYLLQYQLAKRKTDATSWYFFFNEFNMSEFTKEEFVQEIQNYVAMSDGDTTVAIRSLNDDFTCIVNTYLPRYKTNSEKISPENNIDCPFGELGLIDIANKKKRTFSYNGGYISYLSNQRFNTEFVSSSFRNENANMQQQNDIRYAQRLRTSGEEIRTSGDGINMNVNNNSSGRVGINSQYTFGNNSGMSRVISNRSEVMSSERVMGDFGRGGNQFSQFDQFGQSGLNQRSGNYYYFSSTYNQSSSSMGASNALSREPMDGNPRNRKVYYESKRVDFSKLEIEPRDSRRK